MEDEVKLLFAGDISTYRGRERIHGRFAENLMAGVRQCTAAADLAVANFENPIAPEGIGKPVIKSGPCLCGLPENIDVIKAGGFACVSLANNHFGDYGEDAMRFTFEHLRGNGIAFVGAGLDLDGAYEAFRFEKNGIRVSLIAACENEFGTAGSSLMGTAGFSAGRMYRKIRDEKKRSDYVVVFFHGGNEDNPFPSPLAAERYRLFVEYGADAVVAGHTHCMQGTEIYKRKPIVYSMGNLYFASEKENAPGAPWDYGYLVSLSLRAGGAVAAEFIPYRQSQGYSGIEILCGDEKARVLSYLQELSRPIQDPELLMRLFEGWSLITGPVYAGLLKMGCTGKKLSDTEREATAHVLNNFSCEAHRELLKTLFRLQYEGRLTSVQAYRKQIEQYQKIPV